jgi:hypothetical protein
MTLLLPKPIWAVSDNTPLENLEKQSPISSVQLEKSRMETAYIKSNLNDVIEDFTTSTDPNREALMDLIWKERAGASQLADSFLNKLFPNLNSFGELSSKELRVFGLLWNREERPLPVTYIKEIILRSQNNDPIAQFMRACMYLDGVEIEKNYTKALHWFKEAARQEDPYAQSMLGFMYAQGIGVVKNEFTATAWLIKGAKQGVSEALDKMKDIFNFTNDDFSSSFSLSLRIEEEINELSQKLKDLKEFYLFYGKQPNAGAAEVSSLPETVVLEKGNTILSAIEDYESLLSYLENPTFDLSTLVLSTDSLGALRYDIASSSVPLQCWSGYTVAKRIQTDQLHKEIQKLSAINESALEFLSSFGTEPITIEDLETSKKEIFNYLKLFLKVDLFSSSNTPLSDEEVKGVLMPLDKLRNSLRIHQESTQYFNRSIEQLIFNTVDYRNDMFKKQIYNFLKA